MAKDPAFLFYSQDFFVGVATMSFEDRGKYITLLCLMHQSGRMSEETIRLLVGSPSVTLKSKFEVDENGLWFNERLEVEAEKRVKFTESRRLNGLSGGRPKANGKPKKNHMDNHMEDENENEIVIKKRGVGEKSKTTAQIAFDLIPDTFHGDEFAVLWDDYEKLRKQKKKPLTETAVKQRVGQLVAISGGKWDVAKAIMEETISSGWDRFFAPNPKTPQNGHDPRYSATFVKDKA